MTCFTEQNLKPSSFLKSPDACEILAATWTFHSQLLAAWLLMEKKDLKISRGIIPGYEHGCFEPATNYDRSEFKNYSFEDPRRRDNRISIRVSGKDLEQLHKLSLQEGVPSQSLIANIVHRYVNGLLLDAPALSQAKPLKKPMPSIARPLFAEEKEEYSLR